LRGECKLKAVAFGKHFPGLLRVDNRGMKLIDCLIVSILHIATKNLQKSGSNDEKLIAHKVETAAITADVANREGGAVEGTQ
jgi:hypothetical protein